MKKRWIVIIVVAAIIIIAAVAGSGNDKEKENSEAQASLQESSAEESSKEESSLSTILSLSETENLKDAVPTLLRNLPSVMGEPTEEDIELHPVKTKDGKELSVFITGNDGTIDGFSIMSDSEVSSSDLLYILSVVEKEYYSLIPDTVSELRNNIENNSTDSALASFYNDDITIAFGVAEDDTLSVIVGENISPDEISSVEESSEEESSSPDVPREYLSASEKARSYNAHLHMSKADLYDQLTSEYGGQFSDEAAQYAIDNLDADYMENALLSAESYLENMDFSKQGLYDQLTSEHGAQFTAEEAQYAVDNVEADWKAEALEAAISYQEHLDMSPAAIYDQLVSEYGGQFTPEEAQYAIDNLPQ